MTAKSQLYEAFNFTLLVQLAMPLVVLSAGSALTMSSEHLRKVGVNTLSTRANGRRRFEGPGHVDPARRVS